MGTESEPLKKPKRVIVINPADRTVKTVEVVGEFLDFLQKTIGCQAMDIAPLSIPATLALPLGHRHSDMRHEHVWVDDSGLINGTTLFFKLPWYHSELAGIGVISASDEEGEEIETKLTEEIVRRNVKFRGQVQ
jgi:hypothetical protein